MSCSDCPYGSRQKVAMVGDDPELLLIGGAPSKKTKKAYDDAEGKILHGVLAELGIENAGLGYAVCCPRPELRGPDTHEFKQSEVINCARSHIIPSIKRPKAIVAMGKEAWTALHHGQPMSGAEDNAGDILSWRGIPTIRGVDPFRVLGNPDAFSRFKDCIERGHQMAQGTWKPADQPTTEGAVTTPTKIHELFDYLLGLDQPVTFDIETQGETKKVALNEYKGELIGIAFSDGAGCSFYVPLSHSELPDVYLAALPEIIEHMKQVLLECALVAHNAKFDCRWVYKHLGIMPSIEHDTMAMHRIFEENTPHRLEFIARWLADAPDWKDELVIEPGKKGYKYAPLDVLGEYAARDAYWTARCFGEMWGSHRFQQFVDDPVFSMYSDLEQPLLKTLLEIEITGTRVDVDVLPSVHDAFTAEIAKRDVELNAVCVNGEPLASQILPGALSKLSERVSNAQEKHPKWGVVWDGKLNVSVDSEAKAAANWLKTTHKYMDLEQAPQSKYMGSGMQVSSDAQVGWLFFDCLGLTPTRITKTGPSVSAPVLEEIMSRLEEPLSDGENMALQVMDIIGLRRKIAKLESTYVKPLLTGDVLGDDGRVHPSYGFKTGSESSPKTGRLSASSPNLTNQPASMSPLYIPDYGWQFIYADYSQAEIRSLAHLCRDPGLLAAIEREDVHQAVAAWLFNVDYDAVTPSQRSQGKTLNFGLLYGMGPKSLAVRMETSEEHAESLIQTYFARLPLVSAWIKEQHSNAKKYGQVWSDIGRIRRLGSARYTEGWALGKCERKAANAPIQSLAADITFLALIRIRTAIPGYQDYWRIVNTVHDSVLIECRKDKVDIVKDLLYTELVRQPYPTFSVPLKVDMEVMDRWGGELDIEAIIRGDDDE